MKYKIFTYPIPPPEEPEELNGFLCSHKVVSTQFHMVANNGVSYLVFIVEYLDSDKVKSKASPKIDYREMLSEEDFIIFSQLRDLRKSLADQEGVPVYAVFTNAQLAQIVEEKIADKKGLVSIQGVGKSKIEKYGKVFIDLCQEISQNYKSDSI